MKLGPLFGESASEEDEHWLSVSDLMAGLMVIFLFIAIIYIRPMVEIRDKVREIVVAWSESEVRIYEELKKEFKDDLPRWGAELDRRTLSIRFKSPDVLFTQNSAALKPRFRQILDDFFPRYLKILYRFKNAIAEVRIEGHTSSEWTPGSSRHAAYFGNMKLSQDRTRAVLEYSLNLPTVAKYEDWVRKYITANGLSSSRTILRDGKEDQVSSRRVEFRIRTSTKEEIVKILETVK